MCGAFIVLWLDVGAAAGIMEALPGVVKIAVLICWLGLAAARSLSFLGDLVVTSWPLLTMMLVVVLYTTEIAESGQYLQGMGYLFIATALFCFYSEDSFRRERNVVLLVMVGDLTVTGLRTLIALQTDPLLSRYLATTEDARTAVYGSQTFTGLGGYGHAYSLAALLVVLMYFAVRSARKVTILTAIAICAVLVLQMAFTTAIVLAAVLGGGFLIRDRVDKAGLRLILLALALIGWMSGLYAYILRAIVQSTGLTPDIDVRLKELADFLSDEMSSGSDLGSRLDLWAGSLQLFLSSGPFGLVGRSGGNQEAGGHSQWLDLLANYGIWLFLLFMFFTFAWSLIRRRVPRPAVAGVGRGWLFMLLLGFVNTLLFSTIVLTWMFLLPALALWFIERRSDADVESQSLRVNVSVTSTSSIGAAK